MLNNTNSTIYKTRHPLILLAAGILFLSLATNVFAHAAVLWCYVEDDKVYVEAFFMGGKKVQNGKIYVIDKKGDKIIEAATDKQGLYNFVPPFKDDMKIILRLDSGHGTEFELTKQDFLDAENQTTK